MFSSLSPSLCEFYVVLSAIKVPKCIGNFGNIKVLYCRHFLLQKLQGQLSSVLRSKMSEGHTGRKRESKKTFAIRLTSLLLLLATLCAPYCAFFCTVLVLAQHDTSYCMHNILYFLHILWFRPNIGSISWYKGTQKSLNGLERRNPTEVLRRITQHF